MSEIKTFTFNERGFESLKEGNYRYGEDWPVVYIIDNGVEAYVGKTTRVLGRSKEHYKLEERKKLTHLHIITDPTYNMSAITDIESSLIQYMSADGSRILQNANGGTQDHSYYDREMYQAKFTDIWSKLLEGSTKLAKKTLIDIANSDLFKYSPYKILTEDQDEFVKKIVADIKDDKAETYIVNGQPGTGKTVLATYLMKYLKEQEATKDLKIALVIPMGALRKTIQSVFKNIKGLKANMVVTASDVAKSDYDLVIVDESHRLKRRKNLGAAFGAYDNTNKRLGLDKESTHVDWIMQKSKRQIFFYDKDQSVMPADVGHVQFDKLKAKKYDLTTQLRVDAGTKYIDFVRDMLYVRDTDGDYGTHDIKLYDDPSKMVADIKKKDGELGLCRMVAGYAWPWLSNPDRNEHPTEYDIDLGSCKLKWNSTAVDWVNSPNSLNEVGCIHTTQGYDLNYVGVIIGPELKYDPVAREMVIDRAEYYDKNGRMGVVDDSELKQYIINIYKTLLVRGIKGTYIYAVDENLREYLRGLMPADEQQGSGRQKMFEMMSPDDVMIPLLGHASCGDPIEAINNPEEEIAVDKNKIRPGYQYFIIMADGDSMNLAGIQDGDLVLCKFGEKGETGDRVVALLNNGEDVTIKMYDKQDGRRILLPKSDNKDHQPIVPDEGDSVIGVVQEVLELND